MIFVRSLRPDRVGVCVSTFVIHNLGQRFVEPPVLDFHSVVSTSRWNGMRLWDSRSWIIAL